MEVKRRKKYSKEYKEDVLNILKTGEKSVRELSRELEISEQVIYRWYKKYNNNSNREIKINEEEKEVLELRARLAAVTEERDILKKAVSIFSRQGNLK